MANPSPLGEVVVGGGLAVQEIAPTHAKAATSRSSFVIASSRYPINNQVGLKTRAGQFVVQVPWDAGGGTVQHPALDLHSVSLANDNIPTGIEDFELSIGDSRVVSFRPEHCVLQGSLIT